MASRCRGVLTRRRTEPYSAVTLAPLPADFPSDELSRTERAHADVYAGAGWVRDKYRLVRTDFFPPDEVNTDAAAADAGATTAASTSQAMALAELPGDTPPGIRGVSGSSVSDLDNADSSKRAKEEFARKLATRAVLEEARERGIPPEVIAWMELNLSATSSVSAASERGSTTATAGPVNPVSSWHSGHATPRDDEEAEP